ncbi:MAG: MATE family efflux transporter [Lachnospiraceae bacterium]|nr:MATE family efflux transporter [Lachnospiraceae bacterium]
MNTAALSKIFEPKRQIPKERKFFSGEALFALIFPIVIEQALSLLVGIADTFMVSYAGEAAISGIALVTQIDNVFIVIFAALAAGGSVVISQYIGRKDQRGGISAAGQLVMASTVTGLAVAALLLIFADSIFSLLFGSVDREVHEAGVLYMRIAALSFPFLGIYNACAGTRRSMGDTRSVMYVAMLMNGMNIAGNAVGIFALKAGVAGVAVPSLISRITAAAVMLVLTTRPDKYIFIKPTDVFRADFAMIKRIFRIAVPGSLENGLFMLAKLFISTVVAAFGTVQIAAYGVAQSFWSMSAVFCLAMTSAFITVIGRYMGSGDAEGAQYYMSKLLRIGISGAVLWNAAMFGIAVLMIGFYSLGTEAAHLAVILVLIHNVFNGFLYAVSSGLSSGMRAAGDVRYSLVSTIASSVIVRVAMSVLLGKILGFGVAGVAFGMVSEWLVKAILMILRYRSGKWKNFRVI